MLGTLKPFTGLGAKIRRLFFAVKAISQICGGYLCTSFACKIESGAIAAAKVAKSYPVFYILNSKDRFFFFI